VSTIGLPLCMLFKVHSTNFELILTAPFHILYKSIVIFTHSCVTDGSATPLWTFAHGAALAKC